jgi:hypothetical protein
MAQHFRLNRFQPCHQRIPKLDCLRPALRQLVVKQGDIRHCLSQLFAFVASINTCRHGHQQIGNDYDERWAQLK